MGVNRRTFLRGLTAAAASVGLGAKSEQAHAEQEDQGQEPKVAQAQEQHGPTHQVRLWEARSSADPLPDILPVWVCPGSGACTVQFLPQAQYRVEEETE